MHRKILCLPVAVLAVFGSAYPASAQAAKANYSAADLRTAFDNLLVEHVYVLGLAIGSAVRGDQAEYAQASQIVDQNNIELGQVVGAGYGSDAQSEFLGLWSNEVNFTLDYARAAAAKDAAGKQQAQANLATSRAGLDKFITKINPAIRPGMLSQLMLPQQTAYLQAADAFAAQDPATALNALQGAAMRMQLIGDPLAISMARQMPDKFADAGAVDSGWANLRVSLNLVLQEDAYLIFYTFNAATHGRDAEFKAASALQEQTTQGMAQAIGSIYDPATEKEFLDLWHAHNAIYPLIAQSAGQNDAAMKQDALAKYEAFKTNLDDLLSRVNPNIPKGSVVAMLGPHESALTASISALATGDLATAYAQVQVDAHYMQKIADPIALAIGKQFPDKFGAGVPGRAPVLGAPGIPVLDGFMILAALLAIAGLLGLFYFYLRGARARSPQA